MYLHESNSTKRRNTKILFVILLKHSNKAQPVQSSHAHQRFSALRLNESPQRKLISADEHERHRHNRHAGTRIGHRLYSRSTLLLATSWTIAWAQQVHRWYSHLEFRTLWLRKPTPAWSGHCQRQASSNTLTVADLDGNSATEPWTWTLTVNELDSVSGQIPQAWTLTVDIRHYLGHRVPYLC